MNALLAPGRKLTCTIGDFDAEDVYEFNIRSVEPLAVDWELPGCGAGALDITADAVESATRALNFSQGAAYAGKEEAPPGPCATHTPPFLASRAMLRRLKAGESVAFELGYDEGNLALVGSEKIVLEVDGEARELDCLHAADDEADVHVWILDDEAAPLLLKISTCGGDNGVTLNRVES